MIRAVLTGSDTCTAAGLTVRASATVLAMCRQLLAAGHDPATRLQAWRGSTLCLTVRSIGEGARLEINSKGTGFVWAPTCAQPRPCAPAPNPTNYREAAE
jgi:hypothetical protein